MEGPVASLSSADGYAQAGTQERAGRVESPRPSMWLCIEAGLLAHGLRYAHPFTFPPVGSGLTKGITVYSCGGSQGIDPVPS